MTPLNTAITILTFLTIMNSFPHSLSTAKRTYCDPQNRPADCDRTSPNVCVKPYDCSDPSCRYDSPKKCACLYSDAEYYTSRPCQSSCSDYDLENCQDFGGYVCGTKKNSCGKPTWQTYKDLCTACKIAKVETFNEGTCETEEGYSCKGFDKIYGGKCPTPDGTLVCGVKRGQDGKAIKMTYESECAACIKEKADTFRYGICATEEGYSCLGFDGMYKEGCSNDTDYVCGTKKGSDGESTKITYRSMCEACVIGKAETFTNWVCAVKEGYSCLGFDEMYKESCPTDARYVCGTKKGPDGQSTTMTYQTDCTACSIEKADTFTYGVCEAKEGYSCKGFEKMQQEITDTLMEGPYDYYICGIKTDSEGKTIQTTYENELTACITGKADTFTYGICENEEGYSCEGFDEMYERGWDCTKEILSMVCGAKKESNGKVTHKTYDNACVACTQGKALTYQVGMCAGDEGMRCDSRAEGVNCLEGYTIPVVGWGGEGSNYRKTFWNSCMACDDPSVKLYVESYEFNCSDYRPNSCPIVIFWHVCGINNGEQYDSPCLACEDLSTDAFEWCEGEIG